MKRWSGAKSGCGGSGPCGGHILLPGLKPLRVTDPRSVGRPNVGGMSSCAVVWVLIEFFMFICPYQTRAL
jgi:hypothetical protein